MANNITMIITSRSVSCLIVRVYWSTLYDAHNLYRDVWSRFVWCLKAVLGSLSALLDTEVDEILLN